MTISNQRAVRRAVWGSVSLLLLLACTGPVDTSRTETGSGVASAAGTAPPAICTHDCGPSTLRMDIVPQGIRLPSGGHVTIELLSSDAAFHNTLALASPGAAIASGGCKLEPSTGLPGLALMSEKSSVHGCRIDLDADASTAGIQGFAAGTILQLGMCAQQNADPACENVWSSDPSQNSDSFNHVKIIPVHSVDFPNQIYQLGWEDTAGGGDNDFNDLIAVVRVDVDSDGDGLWDDWEKFGVDVDGDGTVDLDLPALGAKPDHKDVFVEVDWMDCAVSGSDCPGGDTHSHRPKASAVAAAVQAFASAPVLNPDGTNGIALHVDQSNSIAHQNVLNINGLCFAGGAGIGSFDAVKADPSNFGPNNPRRYAYHYALFTHNQSSTSTSSGCGELPGNDFQVSLGGWNVGAGDLDGDGSIDAQVGTISQQAGTLIHELGHNLNLQHGGADGINFKPNFVSLMNYWFQTGGVPPTDPDGAGPLTGRVDYSRVTLSTLTETSLSEAGGVGAGTDNSFFKCPLLVSTRTATGSNAADFNCNGLTTDANVSTDLNGDSVCINAGTDGALNSTASGDDVVSGNVILDGPDRTCNSSKSGDDGQVRASGNVQPASLVGWNDWQNIKYGLQSTGNFEDGAHDDGPRLVEVDYPIHFAELTADLGVTVDAPGSVTSGADLVYSVAIKNSHPVAARGAVLSYTLPAGVTPVSCTADHGGVCASVAGATVVKFDAIGGGETALVNLRVNVACADANGSALGAAFAVTSITPDANAADNQATASVTVQNPPPHDREGRREPPRDHAAQSQAGRRDDHVRRDRQLRHAGVLAHGREQ